MKNKIMLITYADSFGKDLKERSFVITCLDKDGAEIMLNLDEDFYWDE